MLCVPNRRIAKLRFMSVVILPASLFAKLGGD